MNAAVLHCDPIVRDGAIPVHPGPSPEASLRASGVQPVSTSVPAALHSQAELTRTWPSAGQPARDVAADVV